MVVYGLLGNAALRRCAKPKRLLSESNLLPIYLVGEDSCVYLEIEAVGTANQTDSSV